MAKFRITYLKPDYGVDSDDWEEVTEEREFLDEAGITAEDWAEDYAYAMADKHRHSVERVEA